jgi:hypothetical protein
MRIRLLVWFGMFWARSVQASSSHLVSCDCCIHEDSVPMRELWMELCDGTTFIML